MAINIARVQTPDRLINQLQQNIASAIEPIFLNPIGSFAYQLTGFSVNLAGTAYYQTGTVQSAISIAFPAAVTGTSNASTMTLLGLPASLWPVQEQTCFVRIKDNGTIAAGLIVISTNGGVSFAKDAAGSVFTASGAKGLYACNFNYVVGI